MGMKCVLCDCGFEFTYIIFFRSPHYACPEVIRVSVYNIL